MAGASCWKGDGRHPFRGEVIYDEALVTYVIAHLENRITIGDIVLTSCGEEISALCQLGSADGLLDLLIERMAEQDAFLVEMPDRFAVNKVGV